MDISVAQRANRMNIPHILKKTRIILAYFSGILTILDIYMRFRSCICPATNALENLRSHTEGDQGLDATFDIG